MDEFNNQKLPIIVVAGPTAVGKTNTAIEIALSIGGEIVSADSMQIYRKLDIGTAKPTPSEREMIKHHLIDIKDPSEKYTVFDFLTDAEKAVDDIVSRRKVPVICGGTGLYIDSLINGIKMLPQKENAVIRGRLSDEYDRDKEKLFDKLKTIDFEYFSKIHSNDKKRIVRALELYEISGKNMTEHAAISKEKESSYNPLYIVLFCGDRDELYKKTDERVENMLRLGLVDEAKLVYDERKHFVTAAQAIGYKEFFPFFENISSLDECVQILKKATRNYAKRQMTWFRKNQSAVFIDSFQTNIEDIVNSVKELWKNHMDFDRIS